MDMAVSLAHGDFATTFEQSFSDQSAAGLCQTSAANVATENVSSVVEKAIVVDPILPLEREAQRQIDASIAGSTAGATAGSAARTTEAAAAK